MLGNPMHRDYYETYWSEEGFNPEGGLGPEIRRLLPSVLRGQPRIVDVGCGDAAGLGRWASERGIGYLGFDISESALAKARSRGLAVERIEDAAKLPLPDASESVVACLEVLEHLLNPIESVVEMRRILHPGGLLVATVPNAAYWVRRVELGLLGTFNPYGDAKSKDEPWRDPHVRFFTPRTLRTMMRVAGFTEVSVSAESHPVFSLRTRVESSRPYRAIMRRRPGLLAPSLLVLARVPTNGNQ
jgi:SAM-dependent methyltransferase